MTGSFGSPAPNFRVADLVTSVAYYTDVLEFKRDWGDSGLVSDYGLVVAGVHGTIMIFTRNRRFSEVDPREPIPA